MIDCYSAVAIHKAGTGCLQVGHIKDLGLDAEADDVRVYATSAAQASCGARAGESWIPGTGARERVPGNE